MECKKNAQNSYHKFECPVIESVELNSQTLLALRVTLLAKKDYDQDGTMIKKVNAYCSDRFTEIINLKAGEFNKEEEHAMAVDSACLYYFMKKIGYFNSSNSSDLEDDFMETLQMAQKIVRLNSILIHENTYINKPKFEVYGVAIYSFSSLFNHSCCSNVNLTQNGDTIILRAINTIKKGEQCFISYE